MATMEKWELTWTKLTDLDETTVSRIPDRIPGVYRLSRLAVNGNYYIFYVGQSEDIKQRLLEHLSSNEKNVCIKNYVDTKKCSFRYAKITEKNIRDAAERQMYKHYAPTCNEVEPSGKVDVEVNLS